MSFELFNKMLKQKNKEQLEKELSKLMNIYGVDSLLDTPDFILAEHLVHCLSDLLNFLDLREQWYGRTMNIHKLNEPTIINVENKKSEEKGH